MRIACDVRYKFQVPSCSQVSHKSQINHKHNLLEETKEQRTLGSRLSLFSKEVVAVVTSCATVRAVAFAKFDDLVRKEVFAAVVADGDVARRVLWQAWRSRGRTWHAAIVGVSAQKRWVVNVMRGAKSKAGLPHWSQPRAKG